MSRTVIVQLPSTVLRTVFHASCSWRRMAINNENNIKSLELRSSCMNRISTFSKFLASGKGRSFFSEQNPNPLGLFLDSFYGKFWKWTDGEYAEMRRLRCYETLMEDKIEEKVMTWEHPTTKITVKRKKMLLWKLPSNEKDVTTTTTA